MNLKIVSKPNLAHLSPKEASVILSLVSGKTKGVAAKAAGLSAQSVSAMLHQQHFIEALAYVQGRLVDEAIDELRGVFKKAIGVILKTLDDDQPALRLTNPTAAHPAAHQSAHLG